LTFLNIHIYFIILKTYDQQFTLTTKKSLHIIFKHSHTTHEKHRREAIPDVTRAKFTTNTDLIPTRFHLRRTTRTSATPGGAFDWHLAASLCKPRWQHRSRNEHEDDTTVIINDLWLCCLRLPHQFKSVDRIFLIRELSQFYVAVASCAALAAFSSAFSELSTHPSSRSFYRLLSHFWDELINSRGKFYQQTCEQWLR